MTQDELFKKLVAHCKEYGFIFPSSEIYDGLGAVYDYGQNGVELKNNIKRYWWARFGLQRSADRQQGFEETLPRRRTHRGVDRQTGREDRKGGRKGPQALRRVVRRGEIPRHVAPRRRDGRQTRRGTRPFRRGDERQRPGRTAADHPRLRDRLPHFGHAQLDGGAAVQPDVLHPDGTDGRSSSSACASSSRWRCSSSCVRARK